jgi:hypothetical protein
MKRRLSIDEINDTPIQDLRFRDFRNLKVPGGRDEYSVLRHEALRGRVGSGEAKEVDMTFSDPRDQTVCYRWILRGLDLPKAIRKVKTDLEIASNAIGSREAQTSSDESEIEKFLKLPW